MRVAVTGTPGTGKTAATRALDTDLTVIHLNDVISEHGLVSGTDEERDTEIADLEAVRSWLADRDDVVVESHLAHTVPADRVVVLRCRPGELANRLSDRGEPDKTVDENAESEALDVILAEAVAEHGRDRIYEIDTTDLDPQTVAEEIEKVIAGTRQPTAGTVSYVDYL